MIRPMLFWGLLMCALATIGATVFGFEGPQSPALLYGIGGFMVLLALVLAVTGLGSNNPEPVQSVPDVSPATTWLAFGFVLMGLGVVVGSWSVLVGGGVVLVGIAGLLREARAQRRALRRATEGRE